MAESVDCSAQKYGQSVIKAIEAKYLEDDTEDYQKTEGIHILHNLTAIKAGGISLPQCLALNYCHISRAGDSGRLHELCRHVKELDLAENDLKDWNEVLNLVRQIPNLRFLNLSSNPLVGKMDLHPEPSTKIASLKGLALNNTKVPWETVYDLLDIMPKLEELNLSLNDYTKISPTPNSKTYPQLTLLQFNENHISQWEKLCPLGRAFPQLTTLILIGNKLSGKITPEISGNFPKLCYLNLTSTSMQDWEELESLNNFPALVDVRLQGIPLCEHIPEDERRQLCIARLGNVSRLNGSKVHDLEREDAERAFIRYYMDADIKPQRYDELVKKYGHLDRLVEIDLRPQVNFQCTVHFEEKSELMYITVSQSIKDFKKSLGKFTQMPPTKLRLFYGDMDANLPYFTWEELKWCNRMMHYLNVKDGDSFLVMEK